MANEQAVAEEVTNYKNLNSRIKLKHDTEANWEKATNFTPLSGEICLYTDIKKFKVGDGSTKINNLPFFTNLEDVNSLIDTAIQALTLTEPITIEPSVINGFLSLSLEEENGIITKLEGSVTHQTNKKDVAGIVSAPGSSHNNSAWMTDGAGNPAWRTLPLNPNNSINQAGIVTAPTSSNPNKAWMTDSSGNPGWRAFPLNPVNTVNQAGIVEAPTSSNAYKAWMTDANGNPGWRSNIPNRYIKVLSAGDTEVQIPFDYDNQESNLTVYYNGILMDSPANYNVNTATNTIELEGEAEAGDVITIMGLMGAVSIDFNQQEIDLYNTYQSYINGVKAEGTNQVRLVTETGEYYIDILDTYDVREFMTETEVERKIVNYLPRRVSLTITASTRSEFTIPAFSSIPSTYLESIADNLTVYHNGLLLIAGENYTVDVARGKIIFKDYQADVGDTVTVMGLAGAASIDFSEMAREAIEEIQQAVLDAEETIDRKITEIQEFINQLPDDTSKLMAKNTNNVMDAGYKITMGANYSPSSNNDVATKGSVATQISTALSSMATSIWQKGSTAPTDTKLFWIDTNTSTGGLKYYNGSSWTHVPVAWS